VFERTRKTEAPVGFGVGRAETEVRTERRRVAKIMIERSRKRFRERRKATRVVEKERVSKEGFASSYLERHEMARFREQGRPEEIRDYDEAKVG
jgi:hypothetical protein